MKITTPFPVAVLEIGIFLLMAISLTSSFLMGWFSSLEIDQIFNLFEALLWIAIATVFLFRLRRQKVHRDLSSILAVAFLLFGISDLIEIQTRAWYQPIGLFILKAACVVTFLTVFTLYLKRTKKV